jgi:hypothetical protein
VRRGSLRDSLLILKGQRVCLLVLWRLKSFFPVFFLFLVFSFMMRSGSGAVISVQKLGFVFETLDPFLFCVHHRDAFPGSQDGKVPERLLAGRDIGQDFAVKDGFRMYHGEHGENNC